MKTIGIYPGKFTPWHPGHSATAQYLSGFDERWIVRAAHDNWEYRVPSWTLECSLGFRMADAQIHENMRKTGAFGSHVDLAKDGDIVVYLVSEKDRAEWKRKLSQPNPFFQEFVNLESCRPYIKPNSYDHKPNQTNVRPNVYIQFVPTETFKVGDVQFNSSTEIREFVKRNPHLTYDLVREIYDREESRIWRLWMYLYANYEKIT